MSALLQEVRPKPVEALEFGAVPELGPAVDGLPHEILEPETPNGVEGLESETEGVDANVAIGTTLIAHVSLGHLPHGESFAAECVR